MSRRRKAEKRKAEVDPVYKSQILSKFINKIMKNGKKSVAESIVYSAIENFAKKINSNEPLKAFEGALQNAMPSLEVKSRRIGGSTYQVPVEIPINRKMSLAMKWLIGNAKSKSGCSMEKGLVLELVDCFNKQGATIKKKLDTHKMAEANKAFAHYKW